MTQIDLLEDKRAGLPCPESSASFWHSQPNLFLLGHRTTEDLPAEVDIVIVGSGITGASIARYLSEDTRSQALSVLLLEAREVCWGATGRNGGHCQPLLFDRSADIAAFEVKNVQAVKSYIEENQVDCEWKSVVGCRTFWDQQLFEEAKEAVENLKKEDAVTGKLVDISHEYSEYHVKPDCRGMTLTQGAGQLWPYKYVTFIIEKLIKQKKINVQTWTPVTKVEKNVVHTARGQVKANNIILATNGYTSHLIDIPIVPVRCAMSALHSNFELSCSYGMVGYDNGNPEHDDYLIQRPGKMMFGGGRGSAMYDCVGVSDDDVIDPGEAEYLRQSLPKMLSIGDVKPSHYWTGIKGYSRDNHPWVGKFGDVWVCAGYTGHGMPNATLCGKAVVDMVLGGEGDVPDLYRITPKRLSKAVELPTVMEQDRMWDKKPNGFL